MRASCLAAVLRAMGIFLGFRNDKIFGSNRILVACSLCTSSVEGRGRRHRCKQQLALCLRSFLGERKCEVASATSLYDDVGIIVCI